MFSYPEYISKFIFHEFDILKEILKNNIIKMNGA